MPPRAQPQRRDDQPAYVLHSYAYRETSLVVEAFTAEYGRIALVARGAKRPRSELRGLLQGFQPLLLSWSGAGEMKTLIKAEWRGGVPLLGRSTLLCGFYLNELLLKLLPREDAHPRLYSAYEAAIIDLAAGLPQAAVLRGFELDLLAELGYALPLDHEADTGAPIDPEARYHYAPDHGPRHLAADDGGGAARALAAEPRGDWVSGATLLALAHRNFADAAATAEAKRLMREVLDHYLEQRGVESRRLMQDLQTLAGERSDRND